MPKLFTNPIRNILTHDGGTTVFKSLVEYEGRLEIRWPNKKKQFSFVLAKQIYSSDIPKQGCFLCASINLPPQNRHWKSVITSELNRRAISSCSKTDEKHYLGWKTLFFVQIRKKWFCRSLIAKLVQYSSFIVLTFAR